VRGAVPSAGVTPLMIDASAELRAARLRRIAAVEIARHREALGVLGVALEGSLATGAVWPSSDVDFTVIPRPEQSPEQLLEWEQREALPFLKELADRRIHIDVCGQREGIPWHKHVTDPRALRDLLEGYPESFIRPAEGPFDPGAHWFLDGLAVMQVIDDPEGLLEETGRFVAARRFAAGVWEGRRFALLRELRRQRDLAHEAMERGEADAVYQQLSSDAGFAAVAAQLWLEGAQRICSSKEQDGRLAGVTTAAGCPEAHALYRLALAVEPERAEAVVPLLLRLGERTAPLYHSIGTLPPEAPERRREALVWGAYVAHLTGTLSLAPGQGHPAHVYRSLPSIALWATEYPGRVIAELREKGISGVETLDRLAAEVAALAAQIRAILLDPLQATGRTPACLAAADQLLDLTEARL
jgi:predicted nucleotidyltransferase